MVTSQQINDFVSAIQKCRQLTTAEQDDVISEALERYIAKQAEFEVTGIDANDERIENPVGWLVNSANLIKLEVWRRRNSEREMLEDYRRTMHQDRRLNGNPLHYAPARIDAGSNCNAERSSDLSACSDVLRLLTADEQEVAKLCFIEGLMPAEAGRIMSSSRSTTKSRRDRVRRKLKGDLTLQKLAFRKPVRSAIPSQ